METGYCQLKQKEVVNVKDGKKLGRVCDVVFTFPEGKTLGIVVPGGKGFFRPNLFIDLCSIVKIGEDAILVEVRPDPKSQPPRHSGTTSGCGCDSQYSCPPPRPPRASFGDDE